MDGKTTTGKVLNYQLCKSRIVFNVNYKSIRDNRGAKRIYVCEKDMLLDFTLIATKCKIQKTYPNYKN